MEQKNQNRHLVMGILAHVDAGKTTLSESLLYLTGKLRKQGRVDHKDAYLDTNQMERERGITIFSKTAEFQMGDVGVTLLDTPGHVDFSPEMERTLQVLDYAVLVISAPDGVTGQVRTLWKLLKNYEVPTFLFVNKMDQDGMEKEPLLAEIRRELSDHALDFSEVTDPAQADDAWLEELAVCDETLLEQYLEGVLPTGEDITALIRDRRLYPVYFGSALKNTGVQELIQGMTAHTVIPEYGDAFGARVFKISRDKGTRLTWIKVTGGTASAKMVLPSSAEEPQKIDQLRIYSGGSFDPVGQVSAGQICAVTGLDRSYIGQGLGIETSESRQLITPVFHRQILLEEGQDRGEALKLLRVLEEEEPMLHIGVNESSGEISAQIMGEVETEILKKACMDRFGLRISFGPASIVYKETIAEAVEGVGHYEPLRHYAEVHLLMEPAPRGSGLQFASACRTDDLALNWQRLILTHLQEKKHVGVLTGAEITDMKITLIGGRAHEKHTEGGDFRQSTYRAVRQGLMQAENVLLEPIYRYRAEIPMDNVGRLLSDMQRMDGTSEQPDMNGGNAIVTGTVPAAEVGNYQSEVTAYTHGVGQISFSLLGYEPARHPEEIISACGYDAEADLANPADSVFCSHGAGVVVPWQLVPEYMHVDTGWRKATAPEETDAEFSEEDTFRADWKRKKQEESRDWSAMERSRMAGEDELQKIFERTYQGSSWRTPLRHEQNTGTRYESSAAEKESRRDPEVEAKYANRAKAKPAVVREDYLLVDGYNIIFSWEELRQLSAVNIDAARDRLIEILADFHGTRSGTLILIFDAYKVPGGQRAIYQYHNIYVVFTKEAETADAYIEKTVHDLSKKGNVTVATSDGLVQMIIFGEGARRMSARELEAEVQQSRQELRDTYKL